VIGLLGWKSAGMMFAMNPDQQSSRNFRAFQQLAEKLNSMAAATASGSSKTEHQNQAGVSPARTACPTSHFKG